MISIYDVLKASKGIQVDDTFAELWGRKLSNAYTVATYSGTLPATLTGTKAGYLHRYKIYGNLEQTSGTPTPENPIVPSECGERTENLIRCANTTRTAGGGVTIDQIAGKSETIVSKTATSADISVTIAVLAELSAGAYTLSVEGIIDHGVRSVDRIFIRDNNDNVIVNGVRTGAPKQFTISEDTKIAKLSFVFAAESEYSDQVVRVILNLGSTALPYEPYGYKLPLTSGSTPVDIYIGDDTLSTEEYVDSGIGKIYRMVDGVLTPVDPPVPFPQIPTSAGSTTISWAGQGLAPSEVEFEYERRR